jgi:hypothetical protein
MSVEEKKPYAITDRAGWFVAGRKVPSRRDEDGNLVPLVGHVFYLTDAEAKYELLNLTIEPVGQPSTEDPQATDAGGKRKKKVA